MTAIKTSFPCVQIGFEKYTNPRSHTGQGEKVFAKYPDRDSFVPIGLIYPIDKRGPVRLPWVSVFQLDGFRYEMQGTSKNDALDRLVLLAANYLKVPVTDLIGSTPIKSQIKTVVVPKKFVPEYGENKKMSEKIIYGTTGTSKF